MNSNQKAYRAARTVAGTMLALIVMGPSMVIAQIDHVDIEFEYVDGKIDIKRSPFSGSDRVIVNDFPTSGLFLGFEANPGWVSETFGGLGILPNDQISYEVEESLFFWDALTMDFGVPGDTVLRVLNNPTGTTTIDGSSGPQPGGLIGAANGSGNFHAHVSYELDADPVASDIQLAQTGAFGILIRNVTDEPGIEDSDPFFIVFGNGLDFDGSDPLTPDLSTAVYHFRNLIDPILPGDVTFDGEVDIADFTLWADAFGTTGAALAEDITSDREVDIADFTIWADHFGQTAALGAYPSGTTISSVPEPSAILLFLVGAALLAVGCVWRRIADSGRWIKEPRTQVSATF